MTNPGKTTMVPATSQETEEAIEALLMLGNPPEQAAPDPDDNAILMPIAALHDEGVHPIPPVPPNVEVPDNQEESGKEGHKPGTILGVAINTDNADNMPDTDNQPLETDDTETKPEEKI